MVSRFCPEHGRMSCPICGSLLVRIRYVGDDAGLLALSRRVGFLCFLGCLRVDLHDRVIDGVDYRGKIYCRAVFEEQERSEEHERSECDKADNLRSIEKVKK